MPDAGRIMAIQGGTKVCDRCLSHCSTPRSSQIVSSCSRGIPILPHAVANLIVSRGSSQDPLLANRAPRGSACARCGPTAAAKALVRSTGGADVTRLEVPRRATQCR